MMEDHTLIDEEVHRQKCNNTCLRKQEEDYWLIADGEGPRKAKTIALKNANNHDKGKHKTFDKDKQPCKRLQKGRHGGGKCEHGESKETRTKSQKAIKASDIHNNVRNSLNPPTKGKSTPNIKKLNPSNPIEVNDLDASSIMSSLESNDREDNEDDDEYDVAWMTDREVPQAAGHDAASLFDNDNDIKLANTKSNCSQWGSSSEASPLPTSESEGMFDDAGDSGKDEVDQDNNFPLHVTKSFRGSKQSKSSQCPHKHDAALNNEHPKPHAVCPMVQKLKSKTHAARIDSDDDNKTIPEDNWPKALQLRNGALTQQSNLIHAVCHEPIRIVEKTLVTQHAWPELHKSAHYKQDVLLEAVGVLCTKNTDDNEGKKDAQYKSLNTWLSSDERFVRCIGKWVVDCLSHCQGQIQNIASDQIAIFQLSISNECLQRVHVLIKNDVYVYPGHWAADKGGKPVWMVKISATNILAALYEWCEGKKGKTSSDSQNGKTEKFEGNNFKKLYDWHVETLTKLKKKVNAYHKFMSELYSKVVNGGNSADTGALNKGSALAVLDLDGLD